MNTSPDVQILARFSALKVLGVCGVATAAAVLTWTLLPALDDYQGRRFSPETARFLLVSSSVILTAVLPLWGWNIWNFVTRPGALYISGGRLFIYWAYLQSVPVKDITAAIDLGRAGPLGDIVRLSVSGRRDVEFQTTFMAKSGSGVVASIKQVAAITT
ncbi:hypothetical protein [Brevundimonas subvibrioides]|uniref:hypothetical protein n=1 Tax=Brevundimonas subvibrioides TaxID=74313 RepID=UPI0012E9962A|nr:hypothetical protein [Brevundimonas subvibrioides]